MSRRSYCSAPTTAPGFRMGTTPAVPGRCAKVKARHGTAGTWSRRSPAGQASVCRELCGTIDVLPTFAKLTGLDPPKGRIIDGLDIWPLMTAEPGVKTPHDRFYYYWNLGLEAVRSGPW